MHQLSELAAHAKQIDYLTCTTGCPNSSSSMGPSSSSMGSCRAQSAQSERPLERCWTSLGSPCQEQPHAALKRSSKSFCRGTQIEQQRQRTDQLCPLLLMVSWSVLCGRG